MTRRLFRPIFYVSVPSTTLTWWYPSRTMLNRKWFSSRLRRTPISPCYVTQSEYSSLELCFLCFLFIIYFWLVLNLVCVYFIYVVYHYRRCYIIYICIQLWGLRILTLNPKSLKTTLNDILKLKNKRRLLLPLGGSSNVWNTVVPVVQHQLIMVQ